MINHPLSLIEFARRVTPLPSILATRQAGRQLWDELSTYLPDADSDVFVFVSFKGVEVMDATFADEVVGTLAVRRSRKEAPFCLVMLEEANATCVENIKMALNTRMDREPADLPRLRNCVLPLFDGTDVTLLGKVEDQVLQTFNLLSQRKTLTARDMADTLGVTLNAASTRLKMLSDLGLARRFEYKNALGREYVYKSFR
jgi:hypothetical protein